MNIIKYIITLGNLGLLIWMIMIIIEDGLADSDAPVVLGVIVLLVLNLLYIYKKNNDDFVSTWFKRKKLEELKKIKEIEKNL